MKLTILVDNNTYIDRYLTGEPGVCYFIECSGLKLLFDVGYSDIFLKNAQILGLDLTHIDKIVLSHGHNDHTWGLNHLFQHYDRLPSPPPKKVDIVAHPAAFLPKFYASKPIGMNHNALCFDYFFNVISSTQPLKLSEEITFLGQIPRLNHYEAQNPVGHTHDHDNKLTADYVIDDSAMAIKTKDGLVIVTGCSHAGICNIIEYAKSVTGESKIASVIGGFHLLNADESLLSETGKYLSALSANTFYPSHCTDLAAKIHLSRYVDLKETGVGLTLTFPM
ncbi:MBL fold metallo-hydrolase [Citrobacter sp. ku-bf4]|uniref:MBL fold metallo-hydrolase n=1 Tax=Citrobacter TaxID=544 RepID=UPI00197E61F3|nr:MULTISPECIES: MBL fold metallo-hydrolase [Citrobacter]MBN6045010.1 MBL fold metallo-hydrolase [Citrobacter sp. ku-bf4]MBS0826387.1 MBL fold metallo-hydrolase [Citrobacter amalonaticus]